MADSKLVDLTAADPLDGTEFVYVVQAGADRKTTTQDIADLGGGGGTWGSITGTLSNQTDLQTALNAKASLSGATFTGAVTATNLSGTNTGDQTSIVGITGTKTQFDTAVTDGNFLYVGDITQYTDEMAQDAVGGILVNSSEITFTYNDGTPSITASIAAGSIDETKLDASVNASLDLADSALQSGDNISVLVNDAGYISSTSGNWSGTFDGQEGTYYLARANHTGTQTASTISDFNETVEDLIGTKIVAGTNITVTYNDTTGETTIDSSGGGGGAPTGADYVTLATNGTLTNERVLTAGALIDLVDGGAGSTVTIDVDLSEAADTALAVDDRGVYTDTSAGNAPISRSVLDAQYDFLKLMPRYMFRFFTDFVQETSTTATDNGISETNSGTGASTGQLATGTNTVQGAVRSTTGTTATGRAALNVGTSSINFANGTWFYETRVKMDTLSTSTERYQVICGFYDTVGGITQTDAVAFLYDEGGVSTGSAASANWQALAAGGGSRSYSTTSTAVASGTWTRLTVEVDATSANAYFYIDGTLAATITSANIPVNGEALGFGTMIVKSVGTTARTLDIDYINVLAKYTTPIS